MAAQTMAAQTMATQTKIAAARQSVAAGPTEGEGDGSRMGCPAFTVSAGSRTDECLRP
jgi:hypothetical protein